MTKFIFGGSVPQPACALHSAGPPPPDFQMHPGAHSLVPVHISIFTSSRQLMNVISVFIFAIVNCQVKKKWNFHFSSGFHFTLLSVSLPKEVKIEK